MTMKYFLGTDNGGTMSKAALFDINGKEIAVASRKNKLETPHDGWSERDMMVMWNGTATAIKEVIEGSGVNPADIMGVGNTGHGNGLYLVTANGEPVRLAINSSDSRARVYIEEWVNAGIGEKVLPKTMQCLWPAQPNALLRWLKDNEPESIANTKWVLMAKDWIRFKLTGEAKGDKSDMSALSLMDNNSGEWDQELFDIWGISELITKMPPVIQTSDIGGYVTADAAAQTGLKEGTPVCGGMFDIDACGLASGMYNEGQFSMVAGTWGNNQFISKEPVIDKDVFMTSFYSIPGWYLTFDGSPTSASSYEWFVSNFVEADLQLPENKGKSVYSFCKELFQTTEPSDSLIFLPFLLGSNVDADASACFIGLNANHTRGDMVRAIWEGVVFSHRWHYDRLMKLTSQPSCISLTGGVTKDSDWVQIYADCMQLPVQIPNGSELGALGAAIGAAVATNSYSSFESACDSMVKFGRVTQPNIAMKSYYDKKYSKYLTLLKALKPVWKELAN